MLSFYLLKPDIFENKKALNYYYEFLNTRNIKIQGEYDVESWLELSKILYEPYNEIDIERIKKIRKQMIVTIKGYQLFYPDIAMVNTFDVDEDILPSLYNFKKELRKKYVYDEEKYYLSFEEKIPVDVEIKEVDIESLKCKTLIVPKPIIKEGYDMVFFNMIHFPDPYKECVERDMNVLRENKILVKNKR